MTLELDSGDEYYSREDYEHRHCLAVTRTENGEFIKCLVHTGEEDLSWAAGDSLGAIVERDNQVDDRDDHSRYDDGDVLEDAMRDDLPGARDHTKPPRPWRGNSWQ